jgi:hypothetical protein
MKMWKGAALLFGVLLVFASTQDLHAQSVTITTGSLPPGVVGVAYSQTLAASGGTQPYTWSIVSGSLPAGMSLGALTGTISGTPTTAATSNFKIRVTTAGLQTNEKNFSIAITNPPFAITTTAFPAGTVGEVFSQNLVATGGTAPYHWSIASGSLPKGLSLNGATIGGTPTEADTSSFTVRVTDSTVPTAQARQQDLTIVINAAPLVITSTSLPTATVGAPYSFTLNATGGIVPYNWSIASGTLPSGLRLNGSTISGTPTAGGTSNLTIRVADKGVQQSTQKAFTLVVVAQLTIISPSPLSNGTVNSSYTYTFAAAGGTPSYTWSVVSGALPQGLTLSPNGVLNGLPFKSESASFTVRVTDSSSIQQLAEKSFDLTIGSAFSVTTDSPLPSGIVGTSYSQALVTSGGTPGYQWTITGGQLPPGLVLSTAGTISGTPTTQGTFSFSVRVTDSASPQRTATKSFDLQIDAQPQGTLRITTQSLPAGLQGYSYSQRLDATGGQTPYTWSVSNGTLPSGLTLTPSGVLQGTPSTTSSAAVRIAVTDSGGLGTTRDFTVTVISSVGSLSLGGTQGAVNPAQQLPLVLSHSVAYPMSVSGNLNIAFTPSAAVPGDDPAVQFSTGGRTVTFTFPANSTSAVFPSQLLLLTGTVAGTITITGSIQNGPSGLSLASVGVRSMAPQIISIAAGRLSGGLRVQVTGYSSERRVTGVEFGFDVRGANGTQQVTLSRSVDAEFSTWYRSSASLQFGSTFFFEQTFGVEGDSSAISSVTVTLTNGQGSTTSSVIPLTPN